MCEIRGGQPPSDRPPPNAPISEGSAARAENPSEELGILRAGGAQVTAGSRNGRDGEKGQKESEVAHGQVPVRRMGEQCRSMDIMNLG